MSSEDFKHYIGSQIGGFLMALRARGEALEEYAAAAFVMRSKCNKVVAPKGAMDIVGTGGDGKSTLNISTATALVVAGAGVVVAKHGNRNLSSKSGAADALTELGVEVMIEADHVQRVLDDVGIAFMMAPMHHPAVRHVMPTRQELGTRTIFNILGPLEAVLLNAAAAIVVSGDGDDLKEGVARAAESIDSGAAKAKTEALAKATQA